MKKLLLLFSALSLVVLSQAQSVRTSIATGFFTSPLIWDCTCVPFPGDSIIINHAITLNTDFGYTSGAVIINSSGSLTGNNVNRGFAVSNNGRFQNDGTFDVERVAFVGGKAHNTGTFTADSLLTVVNLEGGFSNTGTGTITVNTNFLNTGNFSISTLASVSVTGDFMHGDSINPVSPALICDGDMTIGGDFANLDTIRGSAAGQICINGSSGNFGTITGNLIVCDISGGANVDLDMGTISGTVQGCAGSTCVSGIENNTSLSVQVYPNPAMDFIQIKAEENVTIAVYDLIGKLVYQSTIPCQVQNIAISEWHTGIYTYRITSQNGISTGRFIKQ